MKRKITIVSLLFVLMFLVACGNRNKQTKETFNYVLSADESEYYLSKYEGVTEEIVVPEEYSDKKVTKILEYAFKDVQGIKKITISNNIEFIGKQAFENSTLEEVLFADGISIDKINNSAFYGAENLNKINIPSGVTKIDDYAFYGAKSLTSINLPSGVTSIGSFSFYNSGLNSITLPNNVNEIKHSAFYGSSNISTISISQNVNLIGHEAFGDMKGLKNINVNANNSKYSSEDGVLFNKDKSSLIKYPEGKDGASYNVLSSVKIIEDSAFFQVNKLKTVNLPAGLEEIKEKAFAASKSLETVVVPKGVTQIAEGSFYGTTNLKNITISLDHLDENKHFGYIFGTKMYDGSYRASQYNIPNKLESITITDGDVVTAKNFVDLKSVKTLNLTSAITVIEKASFSGLSSLTNLTIPFVGEELDAVDEKAYFGYIFGINIYDDAYLSYHPEEETNFYIPSTLKNVNVLLGNEIIEGAFNGISSLEKLSVPFVGKNLDAVGVDGLFGYIFGTEEYSRSYEGYHPEEDKYFYIPNSLKEIIIGSTTIITDKAFYGLKNVERIHLPTTLSNIGLDIFGETEKLVGIFIDENANFTTIAGVLFNKDETTLIKYPSGKVSSNYVVPETVTTLEENAFKNASKVTTLDISNVLEIKEDALVGMSGLKTLILENENVVLLEGALKGAASLITVTLPFIGRSKDVNGKESHFGYIFGSERYTGSYEVKHPEENSSYYVPSTLKEIILVNTINIEAYAFKDVNTLTTIIVPDSVTHIGVNAFLNNDKLEAINVDEANNTYSSLDGVLFNKDQTALIKYPGGKKAETYNVLTTVETLEKDAFINASNLKEIIIDETNENYSSLDGVLFNKDQTILIKYPEGKLSANYVVPTTVTTLEENAFKNAAKVVGLELSNITLVKEGSLNNMGNLKTLTIDNDNLVLPKGILSGAKLLESLTIPFVGSSKDANGIESYFGYIFGKDDYAGSYEAIYNNESFYIPLTLEEVILVDTLNIEAHAFKDVKSIKTLIIPETVTNIGVDAFINASNLEEINVDEANNTYSSLDGVLFNKDQTILIKYPDNKKEASFTVSEDIDTIEKDAFLNASKLTEIIVDENNANYSSLDGVLFNKDQTVLVKFPEGKVINIYEVPELVTTLEENAFKNVSKVVSLNLSNVELIKDGALENMSGVRMLIINKEEVVLSEGALKGMSALVSITLPFVGSSKDALGLEAYFGYIFGTESYPLTYEAYHPEEDTHFYIPSTLREVNLKEGTLTISDYAFKDINTLTKVTIPSTVTNVGKGAFELITGVIIHVNLSAKPESWDDDWNIEKRPVRWTR